MTLDNLGAAYSLQRDLSRLDKEIADIDRRKQNPPFSGCPRKLAKEYIAALDDLRDVLQTRRDRLQRELEEIKGERR